MKLSAELVMLNVALASAAPTYHDSRSPYSIDHTLDSRGITSGSILVARVGINKEDTFNEWDEIIAGTKTCQPVAVIFARGTFDTGNVGKWVGSFFFNSLRKEIPKGLALQGVSRAKYPATLPDYLNEQGGSTDGAESMADQISAYVKHCTPKLNNKPPVIIVSGWSQGAVVAHKALKIIEGAAKADYKNIAALVTFGDPNKRWDNIEHSPPLVMPATPNCVVDKSFPDYLCYATWPKVPASIQELKEPWTNPSSVIVDAGILAEVKGTGKLLLAAIPSNFFSLLKNFGPKIWLLPQHFMYGSNGMAAKMATWVKTQPAVLAAISK